MTDQFKCVTSPPNDARELYAFAYAISGKMTARSVYHKFDTCEFFLQYVFCDGGFEMKLG